MTTCIMVRHLHRSPSILNSLINSFRDGGRTSRSSFVVNHDIGIYLKYASKPTRPYGEYGFVFHADHLVELAALNKKTEKTFIVLVCVYAKEICCITYSELQTFIAKRKYTRGQEEESYTVLATAPKGKSFRVYVNSPGVKKNYTRPGYYFAKSVPERAVLVALHSSTRNKRFKWTMN